MAGVTGRPLRAIHLSAEEPRAGAHLQRAGSDGGSLLPRLDQPAAGRHLDLPQAAVKPPLHWEGVPGLPTRSAGRSCQGHFSPDWTQSCDEDPGKGTIGAKCAPDVEFVDEASGFDGSEQPEADRAQSCAAEGGGSALVLTGATAIRALNCQAQPVPWSVQSCDGFVGPGKNGK